MISVARTPYALLPLLLLILATPPLSAQTSPPRGTNANWEGAFGAAGTDGSIRALAWSGNELFAGGEFTAVGGRRMSSVAMWDGASWHRLGNEIIDGVDGAVYAIAVDGDDVYVGGSFTRAGDVLARNIAVWNRATRTWSPLGKGIGGVRSSAVNALAVGEDGTLYAGGRFVVAGTTVSVNIAQWNGTTWSRVGTGINRMVRTLGVDGGYLYAGGDFTIAGDKPIDKIARYDIAARQWEGLGAENLEADETVAALTFDDDYVYIGGRFDVINGIEMNHVARYHKASGEWRDMLRGVDNVHKSSSAMILDVDGIGPLVVYAMAMRGEELFVGGDIDFLHSQPSDTVSSARPQEESPRDMVKWRTRNEVWSKFPRTSTASGISYPTTGVVKGTREAGSTGEFRDTIRDGEMSRVFAFAPAGGDRLFIGGYFDIAGPFYVHLEVGFNPNMIIPDPESIFASNITLLAENDTAWSPLGAGGADDTVSALVENERYLYAGGTFLHMGAVRADHVARLDKSTGLWEDLSGGATSDEFYTRVDALALDGDDLIVGGRFTRAGGVETGGLARWNTTTREWSAIGAERFDDVRDVAVSGDSIVAVGTHGVAIWNGSVWERLADGPDGPVHAVLIVGDTIYVGGRFATIAGDTVGNVALWNRTTRTWKALTGFPDGVDGTVNALAMWEGKLYVGGNFTRASWFQTLDIASWDPATEQWGRVGPQLQSNGIPVTQIDAFHVGRYGLYIGGTFQIPAESPEVSRANAIALWDGSRFFALGNGVFGVDWRGMAEAISSDEEYLHVGGVFNYAGNLSSSNIARWRFPVADSTSTSGGEIIASSISTTTFDQTGNRIAPSLDDERRQQIPFRSASSAADPDDIFWDERFAPSNNPRGADDEVFALATDDTVLYVGGVFTAIAGMPAHGIAMWNGNDWERLDDGGGEGIDGFVFALHLEGDDLYVGGQFSKAGSVDAKNIAVWNRRTRTWRTLGAGVASVGSTSSVSALSHVDGRLYVGGTFESAGDVPAKSVAMWDGTTWSALGDGIEGTVNDLVSLGDTIYAGGSFGRAGNVSVNNVAYWDGSAWHAMRNGVDGFVNDLMVYQENRILLGGTFTHLAETGGYTFKNMLVWIPEWDDYRQYDSQAQSVTEVRAMLSEGHTVYVGGAFSFTPDVSYYLQKTGPPLITNIASNTSVYQWVNFLESDGTVTQRLGVGWRPWLDFKKGTNGPVNDIVTYRGQIIAAGAFTDAGGVAADNLAAWSRRGRQWQPMISGTTLGPISTLAAHRGQVFAAGSFRDENDPAQPFDGENHLARLGAYGWNVVPGIIRGDAFSSDDDAGGIVIGGSFVTADDIIGVNVARWNSEAQSWSAISPGSGVASQQEISYVNAVVADDDDIFLGGRFNVVDTFETPNVARFDRNTGRWLPLGDGLDAQVWALTRGGDGALYAGGDFRRSGGSPVSGVARWDGVRWQPLGGGISGSVRSLAWGDGRLYVGGTFTVAGGVAAVNIAAWDPGSQTWSPLGEGLDSDLLPSVDALRYEDGSLFAGGFFRWSGSSALNNVARWDGSTWRPLGSGADHAIYTMLIDRDDLYIAGSFRTAGLKPSPYIGLWHEPTLSVEEPTPGSSTATMAAGPNPFDAVTRLHYTITRGAHVRLSIVDLNGELIAELIDGHVGPGDHRAEWRPGAGVATGVYICRLDVDGTTIARKVIRR